MEPPAKRRRHGKSPLDADADDDELCFEPVELSAKRDPGYRLSLQRAYADNRFQATMAHIFEKYNRDFDGIGDEIDMVSGEIVVDNGHLQNMRDEGDVGTSEQGSDEDQGILLHHLLDDDDDDEGYLFPRAAEPLETPARNDEQDDEDDDIMYGRKPVRQSQSLVPVPRPQPSGRSLPSPSLLSGLCGAGTLDFGDPFAFGASPLAFGVSPLAGSPWSLTNGLPGSLWEPPSISPRAPRLLPSPGERYNFPAQDCGSSIWAPNYRFKEDDRDRPPAQLEFGSMRPRPRTRTRPMKSIYPSAAPTAAVDEEVDEDVILTGKSSAHHQPPGQIMATSTQDDTDSVFISQTTPTREPAAEGGKQSRTSDQEASQTSSKRARKRLSGISGTKKKKKRKDQSQSRNAPVEAPSRPQRPDDVSVVLTEARDGRGSEMTGNTLRPARKQDEQRHLQEASRSAARKQGPSRQRIAVEIAPMDRPQRDEYEEVDDAVDEIADSADEELGPAGRSPQIDGRGTTEPERLVEAVSVCGNEPVSQNVGGACEKAPERDRKEFGEPHKAVSSAFCLSDDEMPIWSEPKKPPKAAKDRNKPAVPMTSPGPPDSGVGDSAAAPSSTRVAGSPSAPGATATSPSLPPASGRSEKRRRPRKSQAAAFGHDASAAPPPTLEQPPLSVASHGAAADGNVSATLVEDKSRRLTRELRWLRKLNGPDMVPAHAPSSPTAKDPPQSRPPRRAASGSRPRVEEPESVHQQQDQGRHDGTPSEGLVEVDEGPCSNPVADTPRSPPALAPLQENTPMASPAKPAPQTRSPPPAPPSKPQTPRHTSIKPTRAPSSRRSILSLISSDPMDDDDDADERDLDELGRSLGGAPSVSFLSSGASRKIWKSSARTTEVYHTPVKRRPTEVLSPGSIIKTPGGTLRTCGLAGYRCGRDFCFTCL
ncbi:centromere protein scm3 domain-containing protein [Hirsutella rhossiliensis]|uniref:Centromere protein scm3 domain-containing protein n=1 Tax=Hirsutella rhossiliensis TaxID=111463 RepID=A0A9P8MWP9_9HYPO|nr:centromere protein scm3 domain-containing protein [Hirsutella rhossiliensis]KAH0962422.1 centromere protein scm3 domain-containing protein [Hirsutella rhossiliensis]